MERWTIKQLKELDSLSFAIAILNERAAELKNPLSPLSKKIANTIASLSSVQDFMRKADRSIVNRCCCTCSKRESCKRAEEYKHNFSCWEGKEDSHAE